MLKIDTQDSATHPEFSFNPLYLPHIVEKWITKCLHPHVCSKFEWEKAEETKAEDCNMYYFFLLLHGESHVDIVKSATKGFVKHQINRQFSLVLEMTETKTKSPQA